MSQRITPEDLHYIIPIREAKVGRPLIREEIRAIVLEGDALHAMLEADLRAEGYIR